MNKEQIRIVRGRLEDFATNYQFAENDIERFNTDTHAYSFIDMIAGRLSEEERDYWKQYYEELKESEKE